MSILSKQTTGLALSLVFIFYKVLIIKNREEWKIIAKVIALRMVGVLIPIFLFSIYILKNNILYEFIDYTFYGIKGFSNFIPYTYLFTNYGIVIAILSVIVPITIIYMYYKSVIKENRGALIVLFAYSCASFVGIYPISDKVHFIISVFPTIIGLIYIGYNFLRRKVKISLKIEKYMIIITAILITALSITQIVKYISKLDEYEYINHFKLIPTRSAEINKLVGNFILETEKTGKKVFILDARAAIYMIPINRYNKDFDMFLKGNLGSSNNIDKQLEMLENNKNAVALIVADERMLNWQHPKWITDNIIERWEKVKQIGIYDIYVKGEN